MSEQPINQALEQKLKAVGLGFVTIQVFGGSVHIKCRGRDTAHKWAMLLNGLFAGAKVALVPTMWEAAKNTGTNLRPTMRKGFLVAVSV